MSQQQRYAPELDEWVKQHRPADVRIDADQFRALINQCGFTLVEAGYLYVYSQGEKRVWYSALRDVITYWETISADGDVRYTPKSVFGNSEGEDTNASHQVKRAIITAAGLSTVEVALPEQIEKLPDGQWAFRSEAIEMLREDIVIRQRLLDELTKTAEV